MVPNLIQRIARDGLRPTLREIRYRRYEKYRERKLGIQTMGFIPWNEITDDASCENYEAISYKCLDAAMNCIKIGGEDDVLLDYGCGMGRVVVTAATSPIRRVLGIELSPELAQIARANIERAGSKIQCPEIVIHTGDATRFEVPDDVNRFFFFNPFVGEVLSAVQQKMHESIQRRPRDVKVVYLHRAAHEDAFARCDWLRLKCELPTYDWDNVGFKVYETIPSLHVDAV